MANKEGKMAKYDAKEIAEDAVAVFKMIDSDMNLPEWLEAKITKSADYMNSVKDYLTHHMKENKKDDDDEKWSGIGYDSFESVDESDLGLTYKKGKTVKVKHKTSGKSIVIIDKPNVRKEYEKIGFFAESVNEKVTYHDGGRTVGIDVRDIYDYMVSIKKTNPAKFKKDMQNRHLKAIFKRYSKGGEMYKESVEDWTVNIKLKEGSCGYGIDGKIGEEPAGPHLIKKKKKKVDEGQKRDASNIVDKFDQAYLKFSREVRDVIKMMDRSTGDKTDGKIIDKAYSKGLIPLDKLIQSWNRTQQKNPKIDEYSGMSKWQRDRLDQRSKEKGKKPKKVSKALQKKRDAWSKKYTVKSGGINIAKWKKDGSPGFPKESVNEDVQDLKKVVKELENASKMHLAQSKRIQAHLDDMNVDERVIKVDKDPHKGVRNTPKGKTFNPLLLKGEDKIKALVWSGSYPKGKGSYELKGNKLNVNGINPRDKGFYIAHFTKNTKIKRANLYYDGVHWQDKNKKF